MEEPLDLLDGERPVVKHQLKPTYPPEARYAGITGTVVLSMIVDEGGHVESLKVLESQPAFDEAALRAVRDWEYEPFFRGGKPIRWKARVTLHFKLRDWETPNDRRPIGSGPATPHSGRQIPWTRPPPRFGERGVTELGPSLGLGTARTRGSRAPGEKASSTISFFRLFAGRFFAPGFETRLEGTVRESDHLTLALGATRFARPQEATVGVSVKAGVFDEGSGDESFRGTFASLGVAVRAPFTKYVALSVSAELFGEQTSLRDPALVRYGTLFSVGLTAGRLRARPTYSWE